jgi:hypothetical protein
MALNSMQNPFLKSALAAFVSFLTCQALALEFGSLNVKSERGEALSAEVAVQAGPADVLVPSCIKVIAPGRKDVPAASGVTIFWRKESASSVLDVRSTQIVDVPALALALEADCGAGRSWREFLVQLKPHSGSGFRSRSTRAASGSEWIVGPGESPRSLAQLLYPSQPGTQRRFIQALAEANPSLGIEVSGTADLVAGSTLQMPDWQALAGRAAAGSAAALPRPAEESAQPRQLSSELIPAPAKSVAPQPPRLSARQKLSPDSPLPLRLSPLLSSRQEASDQLRQMLRLEYRLLISFNEQLTAIASLGGEQSVREEPAAAPSSFPVESPVHLQSSPALPVEPSVASAPALVPAPTALPAAGEAALASLPASWQPSEASPAPVKIPKVPLSTSPAMPAGNGEIDWLTYGGLAAVALMLLALLARRRASVPVAAASTVSEFPETVVVEHPARAVVDVDAFFSQPDAISSRSVKSTAFAPPEEKADVNPVMELAEIMLSFGRVEGAAQTLKEYIEANPQEALQPWVKLLDIYRSGDMHEQFDDLAQKLNRNFNVELQHWDPETPPSEPESSDNPSKANSLEEMPRICEQIVSQWGRDGCLDYLHQLLRDNRGGQRSGFTLPVVQEILLLIEILVAREGAGRS